MKLGRLYVAFLLGAFIALAGNSIVQGQSKPNLTSTEPIAQAVAVSPNNSTTFSVQCRALYIGADGNVTVDVANGATNLAFKGAKSGSILPIRVSKVYQTGTSATDIVCLY